MMNTECDVDRLNSLTLQGQAGGASSRAGGAENNRVRLFAKITKAREKPAAAKVKATIGLLDDIVEQGEKAIVFSWCGPSSTV